MENWNNFRYVDNAPQNYYAAEDRRNALLSLQEDREEGRIFGNRGRGFVPAERIPEAVVGRAAPRQEPERNLEDRDYSEEEDNGGIAKVDWSLACRHEHRNLDMDLDRDSHNILRRRTEDTDRDENGTSNSREKRELFRKYKVGRTDGPAFYVPQRPTEDDDEIFGSGISCGINFDKYDEIEVKVSGDNPLVPIKRFGEAGLKPYLVELIRKCNYTKPTPVQKYAIPVVMSGRDMMACAQTGSGKTAAYLIPMVHRLLDCTSPVELEVEPVCKPQALIVAPTRELAIQIFNEARKFTRGTSVIVELCYGGTSVVYETKVLLSKGCDFLVATPGRLLDIIRRGKVRFTRLKFFVLDEADRMLDLGFLPDMEEVMKQVAKDGSTDRQTLMFSATFPKEIQLLAVRFLRDYLFVAVGIVGGACGDIEQKFIEVSKFDKRNKLVDFLVKMNHAKTLIFVEQKRTTDILAAFLSEKNFRATSIHGGREQREREEALQDFKTGRMRILVATSVAARGLDIKNVTHVVNYDLPKSIEEYVHRIGRTGRVGNEGFAVSFYDESEDSAMAPQLVKILLQAKQEIPDFFKKYVDEESTHFETTFGGTDVRNPCEDAFENMFQDDEEEW